jgi:ribosome biogenesis protein Tsr3
MVVSAWIGTLVHIFRETAFVAFGIPIDLSMLEAQAAMTMSMDHRDQAFHFLKWQFDFKRNRSCLSWETLFFSKRSV